MEFLQGVFLRVREIFLENRFHPSTKIFVIHRDVELLINFRGARVEIGRAEEREQAIDHHRFFMNHGRLIFENFHAAFKHAAVSSATGGLGQRLIIIFSWENELHIDVTSDGFDEQINLVSGWCAIGIRNSDTLFGRCECDREQERNRRHRE